VPSVIAPHSAIIAPAIMRSSEFIRFPLLKAR
jgi:hypothetical protein